MTVLVVLFWMLLLLPLYPFVGYPCALFLLAWGRGARASDAVERAEKPKKVSILIAAYNEEAHIGNKLDNLLDQQMGGVQVEVLVGNDGSEDDTAGVVSRYADHGVRLVDLPRSGKAAALNQLIRAADGDVLVFTDAENTWSPGTLAQLLAPFDDPHVGGVGARLQVYKGDRAIGLGDRLYRRYESAIKRLESRLFGAVSLDGGAYAMRRHLVDTVPLDVTDDFYISTGAVMAGMRLVFCPEAVVWDEGVDRPRQQFRRRQRVTVRGMQSLWQRRALLNPGRTGAYALALASHKLWRRLAPLMLILALVLSGVLAREGGVYAAIFVAFLVLSLVAAIANLDSSGRFPKGVYVVGYGATSALATATGVIKFLLGVRYSRWTPEQNR